MIQNTKKICIIGGGISGLTLAYRLHQISKQKTIPIEIHLLEKKKSVGGNIRTEKRDEFLLEQGPDGFLQQKKSVLELAESLNIHDQLITTKSQFRKSMILTEGKLVEVPDGFYLMSPSKIFPFLKSPLLSWRGKIRTLMEFFVPRKSHAIDESLESFVTRRFGKENLEKISQAMLGGIYTADPKHLSMQAALPRFIEMEKKYGSVTKAILHESSLKKNVSGARYGLFGSFTNGMSTLVDSLVNHLPQDAVQTGINIDQIRFDRISQCWNVISNSREKKFDTMCVAVPPGQIPTFFPNLLGDQQKILESIPYASSAILHLAYRDDQIRDKPNCIGFIVPNREKKHFIACSFISNKYENRAPSGFQLLRVFMGGALQEQVLEMDPDELISVVTKEISSILHVEGDPLFSEFKLWPKSMPQYTMGHIERVTKIKKIFEKCPNFYLLGNGYQGVGIPDLVEQATLTAEKILS